jgi:hypothetical protein
VIGASSFVQWLIGFEEGRDGSINLTVPAFLRMQAL